METGSHELAIFSYATVCLHLSVSLNNDTISREVREHKIAICEKIAGLRSGNSSDLNSACLKVLVPVEIFQFSDMHYETEQYRDSTDGLCLFGYQPKLNDSRIKVAVRGCEFTRSKKAEKTRTPCCPKQNIVVAFEI